MASRKLSLKIQKDTISYKDNIINDYNYISNILPNIYLGCYENILDKDKLKSLGITSVLSISDNHDEISNGIKNIKDEFICLFASLDDHISSSFMLENCYNELINFININSIDKKKIFIHCSKGISRSPTIMILYLMKYKNLSLKNAKCLVKSERPCMSIRFPYELALTELEKKILQD